jgi:ribosomal protein L16 Arg81 hydroxylase|tara:strand:+ start:1864 stop:2364 length:501 start_codon:yes stop_codon:yes gene_type:complete
MFLDKESIENIKKRKVTYVKNFTSIIEETYDFNKISNLVDKYSLSVMDKPGQINHYNSIWAIRYINEVDNQLFIFLDFLRKIFNYKIDQRDGVDLYFSFVTNTGRSHVDEEDVFLVGLYGKTIYRISETNEDFCLKRGDFLYIPKGIWHKAISVTPRSIASVGFFS